MSTVYNIKGVEGRKSFSFILLGRCIMGSTYIPYILYCLYNHGIDYSLITFSWFYLRFCSFQMKNAHCM